MGYPGDQGKPDGWPPEPPSRAVHAGDNPYAPPQVGDPYGPPPPQTSTDLFNPPLSDTDPYGTDPYGNNAFGGPYEEGPGGPNGPSGPGPGGAGGPGGPGFGPGMPPPPGSGKKGRRLPLVIGGAVVAGLVLIGGGVGLSSILKDDSPADAGNTAASPSQTPTARPSPTRPVLEPVKLKSRTTDPSPLTLKEAFGKAKFTASGEKYVRTAWNQRRSCAAAVSGAKLTTVIKRGGCTQVLRATYARADGLLVGTVGVFNLETEDAALAAQKAAVAKDAFLEPLPGKGVSRTIGRGEALGTAEARGHYLVMTWVQRPDGKKVASSTRRSIVSTFGQQIIRASGLSVALHYRETEGKPYRS
jgi:hypothetical protein